MSSIETVNIEKIEEQIQEMISEIDRIKSTQESIHDYETTLKNKFKYLQKRSDALFKYILTNYGTENFNRESFDKNINMMLTLIKKIQNSNITQHDASVIVGKNLAEEFIPHLKK